MQNDIKHVIDNETGEEKIAVYAANRKGNMRYNIDGKFYTDKQFDKKFSPQFKGVWKSNIKALFEEIIEAGGPSVDIMHMPLRITYLILREAAQRALELQDEKLISIFCKLAMYEESDPYNPNYDKEKILSLIDKFN